MKDIEETTEEVYVQQSPSLMEQGRQKDAFVSAKRTVGLLLFARRFASILVDFYLPYYCI